MGLALPRASHLAFGHREDELRVSGLVLTVTVVEPAD